MPSTLLSMAPLPSCESQVWDQLLPIALTILLLVLEKATVASCAVALSLKIVCIKSLVTPTCLPDVLIPAFSKSASLGTIT